MIDRGSPEWWRDRLIERANDELPRRREMTALYEGRHASIVTMPDKYQPAYHTLISLARGPYAQLVVDLYAERLKLQGVRSADGDLDLDTWSRTFKRSRMDAFQRRVHRLAPMTGVGYASVWPTAASAQTSSIVAESSLHCCHENRPEDPSQTMAAIKVWNDVVARMWRLDLYLAAGVSPGMPAGVYQFRSPSGSTTHQRDEQNIGYLTTGMKWEPIEHLAQPFDQCALVPFVAREDSDGRPVSVLDPLVPILLRLEALQADLLVASSFASFKQKWATGTEIPIDPETNQPIQAFKIALDRIWFSENEEAKFGAIPETDLRPIISAYAATVGDLAATARIPMTYFVQSELANPPAADTTEAMEVSLNNVVRDFQSTLSEGWENVAAMAATVAGFAVTPEELTAEWADSRMRSEKQIMESAKILLELGVPRREVWAYTGRTPAEVDRFEAGRVAQMVIDTALQKRLQPQPQPQQGPGGGQPSQQPDAAEDARAA